ncbi:transposase [Geobacillus sp. PA-3]|nr:transposase [Geobacillus sp. PA-3]
MQEHFHFTTDRVKLQKQYASILLFVSAQLSSIQIPLQRRNRHLLKQKDEVIITIHVLGKLLGFTSERAWHRFVIGNLFPKDLFPERSRYNRRCRALSFAIKWIRHQPAKRGQHHAYAVVDSLPIELCHFSSNASRQTIPWNCRYWLLCFQKGHFLWVETSPAGHRPRASDGICCHRSVLSRSGGR